LTGGERLRVITKTYPKDTEYITLYPISDVHWGAAECMELEFQAYLRQIQDDPTAAVLLAGDLLNNGIKSSKTDVYKEKYPPDVQKEMMIDLLEPIKDKIIAGVAGNHEYRTVKESCQDVMKDIFMALQIKDRYTPDAAFVKISLGEKPNKKPATYMIYLTHGNGGGAALGSGISRQDNYQISIEGVDISISGHTHKPAKVPSARLVFDSRNNNIIRSNTLIFVCTAWLDYGGYPVRAQMRPTAFYPDDIRLDGRSKSWS
jgi:predicted phosphodiesterase